MFKLFKKLKMSVISEVVSNIIPDIKIDFSFLDINNINIDKKCIDLLIKKFEKLSLNNLSNLTTMPGEMHSYRIEVFPETMTFFYFIDGQKVGQYVSNKANVL